MQPLRGAMRAASGEHASTRAAATRRRVFDDSSPQLDRFGPLLALTLLTVSVLALVDFRNADESTWRAIAATFVFALIGLTLVLALRASGVSRRWRAGAELLLTVIVVVTVVLLVVTLVSDADLSVFGSDTPSPLWVAIALLTPAAVIRRLLQHRRVTSGTMFGAIAAYLLIALAYCYLMLFVGELQAGGFFTGDGDESTTTFMYFSLVVVTTLGLGDVSPANDLARYISASESFVGQIYLVTFVAMLVGLWIHGRSQGE